MEEILSQLDSLLTNLTFDTLSNSGVFIPAKIIAGVGFLIFAYFEGYSQLLGEKFDWKKLGAPLAIILGISFYGTFLGMTNSLLNNISSGIKSQLNLTEDRFYNKLENYEKLGENKNTSVYDEDYEKSLNKISVKTNKDDEILKDDEPGFFKSIIQDTNRSIEVGIQKIIYKLFKGIAQIAIMILLIIRAFFLITLSIFGIFSIAFSIYPPLKGSFATWLQKYINVYLWLPISYIMEYILLQVFSGMKLGAEYGSSDDYSNLVLLLISLAAIIGFAMVPVISGWFLSAATVSAASKLKSKTEGLGKKTQELGKKLAKKSVTGGLG